MDGKECGVRIIVGFIGFIDLDLGGECGKWDGHFE